MPTDQGAMSSAIPHDLTTPEGAILTLEDAYRAKDMEAAIRCRDFGIEAKLMLQKVQKEFSDDPEILAQTTEVLELGYRAELKKNGFPDFRDIVSTFSDKRPYQDHKEIVQLTEHCQHGDGSKTVNQMVVAKTQGGWKVITFAD